MKDNQVLIEYEELKSIYKNSDTNKLRLCDDLFSKAAFIKVQLKDLENQIKKQGSIQRSNKGNTRVTMAYKTYLQTVGVYQNVLKSIDKIMDGNDEDTDDAFDEFMKKVDT